MAEARKTLAESVLASDRTASAQPGRLDSPRAPPWGRDHDPARLAVVVMTHRLDHRPAGRLALAAGLDARFHLGRVELVALGCARLARLGARQAGVDHERALARDQVGRQVAELGAVGDQVQGLGVLLLPRGHLCVAVVERFVAGAFARLARLQAVVVDLAPVALVLGVGFQVNHGDEPGGSEHSEKFAAIHDVRSPKRDNGIGASRQVRTAPTPRSWLTTRHDSRGDHSPSRSQAGLGEAADPVDGGADVRLAGPVPSAEQGPGEERPVVGVVHQAGDDPVDAPPPRTLGCGRRVPLSQAGGSLTPLMGQSLRAATGS